MNPHMEYKKVRPERHPKTPGSLTPEARYWKRFRDPVLIKENSSITHVSFSPVSPHNFAVTSSMHVQLYSSQTLRVTKTISRFKGVAYGANFRSDGKLIVAGDETGLIQVFDTHSRAILRTMTANQYPVHVAQFAPDKTHIMSCSDDKIVRMWDMPTQEVTSTLEGHKDYVRAGLISTSNPHLILSGSYDQTLKLWDIRNNECTMTMDHGAPVNSVLMFPSGGIAISAGGPYFKVWDLLSGGRCLRTLSNHQKSITCLAFDSSQTRLLSGGLDQHVKIYDVSDYRVVHNIKYPAGVFSIAMSPDDRHIAAGMQSGYLSIRRRNISKVEREQAQETKVQSRQYESFLGGNLSIVQEDVKVQRHRAQKLQEYDHYLKSFQYGNALDSALRKNVPPSVVVGLIKELIRRGGLRTALSSRDDLTLEPILKFLLRHLTNPLHTAILCDVTNIVLDLYGVVAGQSPVIATLIESLERKVRLELSFHDDLLAIKGQLEMILASSALANQTPDTTNSLGTRIISNLSTEKVAKSNA